MRLFVCVLVASLFSSQVLAGDVEYTWRDLPTLPESSSNLVEINEFGVAFGNITYRGNDRKTVTNYKPSRGLLPNPPGPDEEWIRPVVFSDGEVQVYGTLGGSNAYVADGNDCGDFVGSSEISGDVDTHAFMVIDGKMRDIHPVKEYQSSHALGVNNFRQIVGYVESRGNSRYGFVVSTDTVVVFTRTPVGTVSECVAINDKGQVLISAKKYRSQDRVWYIFDDRKWTEFKVALSSRGSLFEVEPELHALNENGVAVGRSTAAYPAGPIIATPDEARSYGKMRQVFFDVNDSLVAVGETSGYGATGLVFFPNIGLKRINDFVERKGNGYPARSLYGLNNRNQFVGVRSVGGRRVGVLISPKNLPAAKTTVPDPDDAPVLERKKGLVLLVHGWKSNPEAWCTKLGIKFKHHLKQNPDRYMDWSVVSVDWSDKSGFMKEMRIGPAQAASNAYELGGEYVEKHNLMEEYDLVHIVAHSAGSWFASAVADALKDTTTYTHLTLLDAYVPLGWIDNEELAVSADYAEHYLDGRRRVTETVGAVLYGTWITGPELRFCENINVSRFDRERVRTTANAHRFAYEWYINSRGSNIGLDVSPVMHIKPRVQSKKQKVKE